MTIDEIDRKAGQVVDTIGDVDRQIARLKRDRTKLVIRWSDLTSRGIALSASNRRDAAAAQAEPDATRPPQ